jgi:general secretion pathway protein G
MNAVPEPGATLRSSRGLTLVELLIVVAIIGIIAAIGIQIYANVERSARISKAQADSRTLGSAVGAYLAAVGSLPPTLAALTAATSGGGTPAGPFIGAVPAPPPGWSSSYSYATSAGGRFLVCAAGDGTTARSDGSTQNNCNLN